MLAMLSILFMPNYLVPNANVRNIKEESVGYPQGFRLANIFVLIQYWSSEKSETTAELSSEN